MDEFTCKKCKKKFNKKQNYIRHTNRLNDCVTGSKTKRKLNYHSCEKCKKKFNRKDSLQRHLKMCKHKKIIGAYPALLGYCTYIDVAIKISLKFLLHIEK